MRNQCGTKNKNKDLKRNSAAGTKENVTNHDKNR